MSGLSPSATRRESLRRMREATFDVLVIGGGVVGAGVARDAASRGFATALVERGDFASGTSGRTSRLVHGGLRYLRSYRFGLVRQAVRERDILLRRAPALVHPMPFVIPAYRDRRPGQSLLRFALFLYDFLSREKGLPRHVWLRPPQALQREPRLATLGLEGAGLYHDAWTDDARFVLALILDAMRAGAAVANYTEVREIARADGRVLGARVVDRETGEEIAVRSRVVVNATGVWLDRLRAPRPVPTIRPTKGIHIFVPRARVGNHHAFALSVPRDGRVVFVLPWGDLTLAGTTDTDFAGDADRVLPEPEDVAYLLAVVNDAFPDARLTPGDVVSAYAGLRPLLRKGHRDRSESEVSRDHSTFEDGDGLISVAGGKLTTHRAIAEEVVDLIATRLRRRIRSSTRDRPFGPPVHPLADFVGLGFDETTAIRLQRRFAPEDLRRHLDAPLAREAIQQGSLAVWAEVDVAIRDEMALSLSDVLVRRLGLFYEAKDQGVAVALAVAERMSGALGWDAARVEREAREYNELVAAHQRFRP